MSTHSGPGNCLDFFGYHPWSKIYYRSREDKYTADHTGDRLALSHCYNILADHTRYHRDFQVMQLCGEP